MTSQGSVWEGRRRAGHLTCGALAMGVMLGRLSESEETEPSSFLGRAWLGRGRVWDFSIWLGPQTLVGNEHGHQAESQSCRLAHNRKATA